MMRLNTLTGKRCRRAPKFSQQQKVLMRKLNKDDVAAYPAVLQEIDEETKEWRKNSGLAIPLMVRIYPVGVPPCPNWKQLWASIKIQMDDEEADRIKKRDYKKTFGYACRISHKPKVESRY